MGGNFAFQAASEIPDGQERAKGFNPILGGIKGQKLPKSTQTSKVWYGFHTTTYALRPHAKVGTVMA